MERVYYDSYSNDRGQIIVPKVKEKDDNHYVDNCTDDAREKHKCQKDSLSFFDSILPNLDLDDIILIGIILILLHDGTDDKLLLVIVGVIFLLGFNEK